MCRMKVVTYVLWLALLFFAVSAFPQTVVVDRSFVVRAETTTVDTYTGMTHICILVMPDGQYRRERSFQGMSGGTPYSRVYRDKLPDDSLKQLETILADDKFQRIASPPERSGIIQNMDTLIMSVPREHSIQNLYFMTASERRPFDKDLKPFLNWMRDTEKRKVPEAKGENMNNCAAPMVHYRSNLPPLELEERPAPKP